MRQLTAAAGDGLLGSVGSPGQLETSLNSGYLVGPCNSYLEGPTPICLAAARALLLGLLLAQSRLESAAVVVARRGRTPLLAPPPCGGARFADARSHVAAPAPTGGGAIADARSRLLEFGARFGDARSHVAAPLRPDAAIVGLSASRVAVGALSMGRMRANKQGACR